MSLEDDLFRIEQGFWLGGSDHFLAHLDDQCLLAFPQAGEMHGIHARGTVAATATAVNRWRDLAMTERQFLEISNGVALISYRVQVTRADGEPYDAIVSSAYARRTGDWKLCFHQHSPI